MAEISLRAYVKEVDNLVEQEHLDEAIAHCRHILEVYPKHVDTYRVLGKAYLEAKRFGDAADIFQRVLSAVPDDFVAHIGMAIVREDEGNLDAAIWHIERAFETNPANPAIQQELRRLIGRRDGLEPHKVRMTRGALARMYAHGELYPQAIAELISALKDDSDRPDLEALLATMYWRSGQDVEAGDVCNRILDKLPHCREANRILAAILQASNKQEDAKLYHRRLAALDPYAAYVETANIDPQTVDASMVSFAKLEWEPGKPMPAVEPGQPEWAASLGVDLGEEEPEEAIVPEEEEKPAWLKDLEKPIEPVEAEEIAEPLEPSAEPTPSPEPTAEAEIPDWMREAGWQESTGEAVEAPISFTEEELSALDEGEPLPEGEPEEEGELAPADIPGWLQDIAPPEPEPTTPEPMGVVEGEIEMGEDEDIPDWLSEMDEEMAEIQPEMEELPSLEPEVHIEEPVAEFVEDIVGDETIPEDAELVDEKESAGLPTWLESETPGATTTIVTWLGDRDTGPPSDEIPEDLEEVLPREPASEIMEEIKEEIPSWLADEEVAADAVEPVDEEAAPSWLSEIAETAAQVEDEPVEDVVPEPIEPIVADEAPSWLSEVTEIPAEEEPKAVASEEIEPVEAEEVPSWLAEVADVAAEEIAEPEAAVPEVIEPIEDEEAPSWLAGVAEVAAEQEPPSAPEEAPSELEPTPAVSEDDVPDWLKSISEPGIEPPIEPTPVEEGPAWLEGIAVPEAELPSEELPIPSPEAPDWLKGIAEPEAEMAHLEEVAPAEDAPDWLDGIAEPEIVGEATGEAPQWMQEFTEAAEEEPERIVEEPILEVPEGIVDIPEVAEPIIEPEVEMVLPTEAEHPAEVVSGEELDDDEVLGWLEGLAARQGVEEEELITTPEERVSELPSEI
ncbi:MAG: tetratricopeptide repeat protein, partial [Candidatus Bathyarchaeota archaeon]|nr:tetratricopeptide repeat protein [Candidatus Bathyarchaeota archaeon]